MRLEAFTLGPWMTRCYLLAPDTGERCWIVDAGFEPAPLIERVRALGWKPAAVLLTHAHVDHVAGLAEVLEAFPGTQVLIHEAEAAFPADPTLNLSSLLDTPIEAPEPTGTFADGARLELGELVAEVRHTPGHSPGGVGFWLASEKTLVAGDALFAGSIGRTDFPTSDHRRLLESIRARFFTLPEETVVLPGHGPETTIGRERASNPFVGEGGG